MKKEELKRLVAELGYDIGYGAKKSLASYDMLVAIPPVAGFLSLAIGIAGLAWSPMNEKHVSFGVIVMGLLALYASSKDRDRSQYERSGCELTKLYKAARKLYAHIESKEGANADAGDVNHYEEICNSALERYMTNQVFLSGIYAHYKLFYETNCDWFVNELGLTFFKDKLPASLRFFGIFAIIGTMIFLAVQWIF